MFRLTRLGLTPPPQDGLAGVTAAPDSAPVYSECVKKAGDELRSLSDDLWLLLTG